MYSGGRRRFNCKHSIDKIAGELTTWRERSLELLHMYPKKAAATIRAEILPEELVARFPN